MDRTGAAAYVISQAVAAIIEALGMHAENQQRLACGYSVAYDSQAFDAVIADAHKVPGAAWSLGKTLAGNAMKARAAAG